MNPPAARSMVAPDAPIPAAAEPYWIRTSRELLAANEAGTEALGEFAHLPAGTNQDVIYASVLGAALACIRGLLTEHVPGGQR